jgi:hypothetical protein
MALADPKSVSGGLRFIKDADMSSKFPSVLPLPGSPFPTFGGENWDFQTSSFISELN